MRYSDAIRQAPPGAARFQPEDLLRLDRWALGLLLDPGSAALPPEDVRAALPEPSFQTLLSRLPTDCKVRLTSSEPAPDVEEARRRVVAGAFWLLVYALEPQLWDALSQAEAVPPGLAAVLPAADRVLEVASGTGRLTALLASRCHTLVAVEPSRPLARLLQTRVPGARIVSGVGQDIPIRTGWAGLTISCASFGPDAPLGGPQVLAELERCTGRGGTVALVGPESPEWFEERGYARRRFKAPATPAPAELVPFFGPRLQPPCDLLTKTIG